MTTPGVLVVWTGNAACLRVFPLGADGFVIGRDTIAETTDDRISREHARVTFASGKFTITDLGSRNGTYAGGHALIDKQVIVTPPGVVRTGRTVSVLVADVAPFEPASIEIRDGLVIGPSTRGLHVQLAALVRTGTTALIVGDPGSGRTSLARSHCAGVATYDGNADQLDAFRELARPGVPLLITNLERLGAAFQVHLHAILEARTPVIATAGPRLAPAIAERFTTVLTVPPLRDRPDELSTIIERTVRGAEPTLDIHSTLTEACLLRPWPGDVGALIAELTKLAIVRAMQGKTNVRGEDFENDAGHLIAVRHADCVFPGYVPPERRRNRD